MKSSCFWTSFAPRSFQSALLHLVVVVCCAQSQSAVASIVATSNNVTEIVIAGGEDFSEGGAFETGPSSYTVWAFEEGQAVSVVSLQVDLQPIDAVATWSIASASTPTTLTRDVSVHYLHFDTTGAGTVNRAGFVEFDAPILGLIVTNSSFLASDNPVGSGGEIFDAARGLGTSDTIRIESGDRRLVFSFSNGAGVDQIRIVTADVGIGSSFTEIVLSGGESFAEGGAFEGDGDGINTAYYFAEQVGVDINNLEVDLDSAALMSGWSQGDPLVPSPQSGLVDSYYVFFDSVVDSENTLLSGTVTFPRPVVGVIFSSSRLVTSDAILAIPGITFDSVRNLDSPGDALDLDITGSTLTISFVNANATDDVRILIESESAVVPSLSAPSLLILGLSLAGSTFVIFRRGSSTGNGDRK